MQGTTAGPQQALVLMAPSRCTGGACRRAGRLLALRSQQGLLVGAVAGGRRSQDAWAACLQVAVHDRGGQAVQVLQGRGNAQAPSKGIGIAVGAAGRARG